MKDFVSKGTGNSRFLKSSISSTTTWEQFRDLLRGGTAPIDLNGINPLGVTETGTPLSKANLLTDTTATSLGLVPANNPTVNDAFTKLAVGIDKVGEIKVSTRTDYDSTWKLCNGSGFLVADYPDLALVTTNSPDAGFSDTTPYPYTVFVNGYYISASISSTVLTIKASTDPRGTWTTSTVSSVPDGSSITDIYFLDGYYIINLFSSNGGTYTNKIVLSSSPSTSWTMNASVTYRNAIGRIFKDGSIYRYAVQYSTSGSGGGGYTCTSTSLTGTFAVDTNTAYGNMCSDVIYFKSYYYCASGQGATTNPIYRSATLPTSTSGWNIPIATVTANYNPQMFATADVLYLIYSTGKVFYTYTGLTFTELPSSMKLAYSIRNSYSINGYSIYGYYGRIVDIRTPTVVPYNIETSSPTTSYSVTQNSSSGINTVIVDGKISNQACVPNISYTGAYAYIKAKKE